MSSELIDNKRFFKVKVIPDFIYRAILTNKLNVVDIETYSLIRKYVSLEELGLWEVANDGLAIGTDARSSVRISTCPLFDTDKLTTQEAFEFGKFIRPLSGSNEAIKTVTDILSIPSTLPGVRDNTYKFIQTPTFLAVVIYGGFIVEMQDTAKYKSFVKKYLEHCNVMTSENEVSKLQLFREYLTLI